jgi:DNA-binding NarL/FixJ family response regulator
MTASRLAIVGVLIPPSATSKVLAEIVADEALCNLPVIVLTTSTGEEEMLKMYKLRCSSYIAKPVDFDQFLRVVQSLADYWFIVVVLPVTQGAIEAKAVASVTKVG